MLGSLHIERGAYVMEKAGYLSNFSYIFIPFSIKQEKDFIKFNNDLSANCMWMPVNDEIRYLHKYVSDRLVNEYKGNKNLFHYRLSESVSDFTDIYLNNRCYQTAPKKFNDITTTFDFTISDVQLFSFNTSICIMAFQLQFENNDPLYIAAAQYYLRKIDVEHIRVKTDNGDFVSHSFIELSKSILGNLTDIYSLDFFFYASTKNERANFFTYIDLPKKENYNEELFHLKWCYNDHFTYDSNCLEKDSVNYVANSNTIWGISPSAAVCIINRCDKNRQFIENTFQHNVQNHYLFTYILLLHQKYMLYLFLTKISIDIDDDLNLLENYKRRLYEFNTKYLFSRISEVPQYQRFYEKVMESFSIKEMFADVQEPLSRLAEIQRQVNEEQRQKRDHNINTALTALSLLTIFSAITDALGITANLGWLIPPLWSKIIQLTIGSIVIILSVAILFRLFSLKNKR